PMAYTILLDSLVGGDVDTDDVTVVAPENPLKVEAGATRTTSVFVLLPARAFPTGDRMITITVTDERGYRESVPYRLLGPSNGASRSIP
ncbi:MAG: FixG Ig-like domain-containing protein, partial [Gemmatimonadaceae bacterium]